MLFKSGDKVVDTRNNSRRFDVANGWANPEAILDEGTLQDVSMVAYDGWCFYRPETRLDAVHESELMWSEQHYGWIVCRLPREGDLIVRIHQREIGRILTVDRSQEVFEYVSGSNLFEIDDEVAQFKAWGTQPERVRHLHYTEAFWHVEREYWVTD